MISTDEFRESLDQNQPPKGISELLRALWWEAKGDWDQAHKIAQDINSAHAAWVHAYLHRKEGDDGNAAYWYSRAGKPRSSETHNEEWEDLVEALLNQ